MRLSVPAVSLFLSLAAFSAGADESAPQASPLQLSPIKVGTKITYQFRRYKQADPLARILLEDKPSTNSYVLESDNGDERAFKYRSGVTLLYGADYAFIGSISKDGERKMLSADTIKHWMPKTELDSGMTWKFSSFHSINSTGTSSCRYNEVYTASSLPAEHELKIAGVTTRVDAIEVDIDGTGHVEGACQGDYYYYKIVYVYSKELDLVLEYDFQARDGFKKMVGGTENRVETVTAIN